MSSVVSPIRRRHRLSTRKDAVPKKDVFPTTVRTWIGEQIDRGEAGRNDLNHHIMSVYAEPLQIYFCGTRDRYLGDPLEVVTGFFADRLPKKGFFEKWEESRLPLRRWLMNAFCFYLHELRRQQRRDQKVHSLPEEPLIQDSGTSPELEMDRAFLVSIASVARRAVEAECREESLEGHWEAFRLHQFEGLPFSVVGEKLGVSKDRARVMARTVRYKLRRRIRELVARDGARQDQVDREIQALLEAVQ